MIASLLTEADRNFPCQYVDLNAGARYSGGLGRPWMEISREQLEYLVENDISIPDIAQVLGVSVSAAKRRGISSTERKTPSVSLIWMRLCRVYNKCSPMPGTGRFNPNYF